MNDVVWNVRTPAGEQVEYPSLPDAMRAARLLAGDDVEVEMISDGLFHVMLGPEVAAEVASSPISVGVGSE